MWMRFPFNSPLERLCRKPRDLGAKMVFASPIEADSSPYPAYRSTVVASSQDCDPGGSRSEQPVCGDAQLDFTELLTIAPQ